MSLKLYKLLGVAVVLFLICGCSRANPSPVIISLTADKTLVEPSGGDVIRCNATSVNGGNLSYNWSASGGMINAQGGGEFANWLAPADAGNYNITVSVTDDKGGKATASTVITVRVNHLPAIISLTTSREKPLPGQICRLECRAEDPDNDRLNYSWEADGGNISGEGSEVSWAAPREEGSYNITVLVTDPMGGICTTSLTIYVGANRPPVIESLVTDKANNKMLKGTSCSITCDATDPDDDRLSYAWSTARGTISGNGATVTWTAPNEAGTFPVMVTVSDGNGGVTSRTVNITLVSCACSL